MGYLKVDFEELLVKTWRDCTKDYMYIIPMIISVLLPLIAVGIFFKFFVDYNYLLLFSAIFLFVISIVFQTWYFTTAKYVVHEKKFDFSSSFVESVLQIPRFIAMYLIWILMLLLTVTIMSLFVMLTVFLFKESVVFGIFSLLVTLAIFIAGGILIIVYIFANVYLMPILFMEKEISFFKVPFVAMKYCLNKKLETFVFLLITMAFMYAAMTPTYIFGFFNKSMMATAEITSFPELARVMSDLYLNPFYIISYLPVVLASVFCVIAMFNLYLMQKKKVKEYGHKENIKVKDVKHNKVSHKK